VTFLLAHFSLLVAFIEAINSTDAKLSSATTTNESLDNSGGTLDGVNAAKVAAMKAAELGKHLSIDCHSKSLF
jgi:hypothetical protein